MKEEPIKGKNSFNNSHSYPFTAKEKLLFKQAIYGDDEALKKVFMSASLMAPITGIGLAMGIAAGRVAMQMNAKLNVDKELKKIGINLGPS